MVNNVTQLDPSKLFGSSGQGLNMINGISQAMNPNTNFLQMSQASKGSNDTIGMIGSYIDTTTNLLSGIEELTKPKQTPLSVKVGLANGGLINRYDLGGLAGNTGDTGLFGKYADAANTAMALVSNGIKQAKIQDTTELEKGIGTKAMNLSNVNSFDDLAKVGENMSELNHITAKDIRPNSTFSDVLNGISTGNQGAQAGFKVGGPWGAAVGGVVGTVSSVIGSIFGRNKAKKKARQINKKIDYTNEFNNRSFNNASENISINQMNQMLSNWAAFGGNLETHGADFPTGLLYIGNGGTHEENPYEGVQIGVDNQGVPNLVEEGETIFNDYVFSKRLKVPKKIVEKYSFKDNITFAEASKRLAKESEERPNDIISRNGLDAFMGELSSAQEETRQKKELARQNRQVNKLISRASPEELAMLEQQTNQEIPQEQLQEFSQDIPQEQIQEPMIQENIQTYANGGKLGNRYDEGSWLIDDFVKNRTSYDDANTKGFIPYSRTLSQEEIIKRRSDPSYNAWTKHALTLPDNHDYWTNLSKLTNREVGDLKKNFKSLRQGKWGYVSDTPVYDKYNVGSFNYGDIDKPNLKADFKRPTINDKYTIQQTKSLNLDTKSPDIKLPAKPKKEGFDETDLRYAPVLGSMIGLGENLLSKPDYSQVAEIKRAALNAGNYDRVSAKPLGDYLSYKPLDRQYAINQLNAQAAATRRNIMNTSGGNRGAAMAGLLAADYNAGAKLGELFRQAEESNQAQRERVATFNRATNQYNSESDLKAQMANQSTRQQAMGQYMSGIHHAAQMKEQIDTQRAAARNANLSNLFESLGNIGREAYDRNIVQDVLGYGFTKKGKKRYTGFKCGGKLKKKR